MNQALTSNLITDLDLGSARGVKAAPLEISVIRALTEADLPVLANPPPAIQTGLGLKELRHSHHRIAQLIAQGMSHVDIAFTTGYSASRISILKGDPAFAELVDYYSQQRDTIFLDTIERAKTLGLDALEKLHEKLLDPTEPWTKRELLEVANYAAPSMGIPTGGKNGTAVAQGGATVPPVSLTIKFVGPSVGPGPGGPTLEAEFNQVESE